MSFWMSANQYVREAAIVLGTIVLSIVSYYVVRRVVLRGIESVLRRTTATWDDALLQHRVFDKLAWLAPAVMVYAATYFFVASMEPLILRLLWAYFLGVFVLVIGSVLSAVNDIYSRTMAGKDLPIKGYIQIVKLLNYLIGVIIVASVALDKSPWVFLSGVGAATAILLLIFRDTLLGFVASIQIASNDMVRIGDWIEMPKYEANGEVIDIALHTVKVQNWDLTITTIPAYKLIEDSFKNWRNMQLRGARRIQRAVHIDLASIGFLDETLLAKMEKVHLLTEYVRERRAEIERYNRERGFDTSVRINGRRMTNIGTFRIYLERYLRAHPAIRQDMPFVVKQREPTPLGLPIEVYVFTSEIDGNKYEGLQSDIFDHILAVVPEFGLRVFQRPSGWDASIKPTAT